MTQTMLTGFDAELIIPNPVVFQWDVEYQGYSRPDTDNPDALTGYIDFHVFVDIVKALVNVRDKKTRKKVKRPGYHLIISMSQAFPDSEWESYDLYDEEFPKDQRRKAIDTVQNEILNIQSWIECAESRARLIPSGKDVFECMFCGWVTDKLSNDITCLSCGKRFWLTPPARSHQTL